MQRRTADPGDYPVQSRVRLFGNKLFAVVEQKPAAIVFAFFPDIIGPGIMAALADVSAAGKTGCAKAGDEKIGTFARRFGN